MPSDDNPCTRCGACCASFRVDFARAELQSEGGSVPDALTVDLGDATCRLRGTDHQPPRCAIHEWRPWPCREFGLRAPLGVGDDACDRARERHGLPSLGG